MSKKFYVPIEMTRKYVRENEIYEKIDGQLVRITPQMISEIVREGRLLCEFYRISADGVLKEIQTELSKKYILSLKYSKAEPDTDLLESSLCCKFGIQKEFWNADTDNIMNYLVSRKETL